MKWIGKRISFIDDKSKTTIVIYPQDAPIMKALMGAWMAMWLVIGGIVIWSFTVFELTNQEVIILVIFLSFWFYYAIQVIRSWAWLMWGKELIKIDQVAFTYKKSVRNYGKASAYYIENIKEMKMNMPKENSFQGAWEKSAWSKGGERFDFEYMGKIIRFGRKLDHKDADLLFKLITKRVESFQRKSKG